MKKKKATRSSALLILQDHRISIEDILESALALYAPDEEVDANKNLHEIKDRLKHVITKQCRDVNVYSLIMAATSLDEKIGDGTLRIRGDPASILCDELIGMSIAEYIGGKKALFNYIRYDTKKPGILAKLGVFMDDAIAGLIAGCMTKLFEDWK